MITSACGKASIDALCLHKHEGRLLCVGVYMTSVVCTELEQLAEHGITLPPNMQGLADEQIDDLKLKDEWADRCQPSGGQRLCKDVIGRRNGAGTWRPAGSGGSDRG